MRLRGDFTTIFPRVNSERGPSTPHLFRSKAVMGYSMVCMDARRAADSIKSR
jgi:hypothetical protein